MDLSPSWLRLSVMSTIPVLSHPWQLFINILSNRKASAIGRRSCSLQSGFVAATGLVACDCRSTNEF